MPKYESNELRTERKTLIDENRSLVDLAQTESRELTSEELGEFEKRDSRLGEVESQIKVLETAEGYSPEQQLQRSQAIATEEATAEAEERDVSPLATDEYREAFHEFMEHPQGASLDARAALQVGVSADGGYTVAQDWNRQLVTSLQQFGVIRSLATVVETADSGQFNIPAENATGEAGLKKETEGFLESEPTFKTIALSAYKLTELIKVTDEMLHDSIFDIPAYVQARAAKNIALKENNYLVTGTGTEQPKGISVAASVGATAAEASKIKIDDLLNLFYSLVPGYVPNSSFVMGQNTVLAVRQTKDKNEQYLWSPNVAAGEPDTLIGRPVYADPHMPTVATGNVTVLFGDFSGYWVRDVQGTVVKFLDQTYAAEGLNGFLVSRRSDGNLVDTAAVKSLKQP